MSNDIFDPAAWQPSVVRSIESFVRKWGVSTGGDAQGVAKDIFGEMLNEASLHRNRITELQLSELEKKNWLAIIGVDAETRVGLKVDRDGDDNPRFLLNSDLRQNKWKDENADERRNTGDGTVPLQGAIPTFLDENQLVCVSPDDYGYWEWRDRGLTSIVGFHGILPNMNMLHRLIARFVTGKHDKYDNTWGRPLPGVDVWAPPFKGELKPR